MRPACFIFLLTIQMQAFGLVFQAHFVKKFPSHRTTGSFDTSQVSAKGGSRTENWRTGVKLGNITQGSSNKTLHINPDPAVNLARTSHSTNAKGFWNHFLFRGKSEFKYVLPIRNFEVRQEKCRALSFSQRISHENCETLELKNNVCFGRCGLAPSSGEDRGPVTCPVCSPVTFTSKTVQLKCIDNTEVVKVVRIIEDCQCETKEGQHLNDQNGPVLVDPSVDQYLHKQ